MCDIICVYPKSDLSLYIPVTDERVRVPDEEMAGHYVCGDRNRRCSFRKVRSGHFQIRRSDAGERANAIVRDARIESGVSESERERRVSQKSNRPAFVVQTSRSRLAFGEQAGEDSQRPNLTAPERTSVFGGCG
ncbi:hypothetical protein BLNAU_10658 [Blattamonas nauphoetae]|uniref:Uncharacterized protein n=1 Tax=Blattamonas nauphoetae TaxID=2049346 RepID=A0ABQ9XSY6_9EUKA|nr:hypothetical protein BLNAU_10658 [Blattamonas nauphoetae]